MTYPYQPPAPGYGPPGYGPPGYGHPTGYPPKSKVRKGPAIAAGVLGILAGLVSLVSLVMLVVDISRYDLWAHLQASVWIIDGSQFIIAIGLIVLAGVCFARNRVVGWLLFGCAVLGLLLLPIDWIVQGISPVQYLTDYIVRSPIGIVVGISYVLTLATAVLALIAALSREGPTAPGMPMAGQHVSPQPYPPYGP